ncbi:MAG: sulfatase [Thermodesulfobacteriota bacterium]|nr:sulfatase [Thermodesulfobacteriota bacterium]
MRLIQLLRKFIVFMIAALSMIALLCMVFCYLEPVKSKRFLYEVKDKAKITLVKKKKIQSHIKEYKPITLQEPATPISISSAGKDMPTRLIDMESQTYSASSLHRVTVMLDGQTRQAIEVVVPSSFSYRLLMPQDSLLRIGLNQEGISPNTSGIQFDVQISYGGEIHPMLGVKLPADHTGWKDSTIDMASFAGKDVDLQFSVSWGDPTSLPTGEPEAMVKVYLSDMFLSVRSKSVHRPNVFLILIDTLRADHLSCYGYKRSTSPNIDRLAEEGILFMKAISATPWTDPSVLALFTGLYPSDVWEVKPHSEAIHDVMPAGVDTLSEILHANGYFTIAASDHPGINAGRFGQGFDIFVNLSYTGRPFISFRDTPVDDVLKQLNQLLRWHSGTGLFTYIHLMYPHEPYLPSSPYDDYFGRGAFRIVSKNRKAVINMYDGEIKLADNVVGGFIEDIRRLKLYDDSIVVIMSDHGEGFWEHGLFEHGNSLYNELLHVPLIFHAPGRLPQGRTITGLARTVDILPTILELVGINQNRNYRGISLLQLIEGDKNSNRSAYSEFPHSQIIKGKAIQSIKEKLIDPRTEGYMLEFYDLPKDPKELQNMWAVGSARDSELIDIIEAIGNSANVRRATFKQEQEKPSEDMLRKLKTLGYIR